MSSLRQLFKTKTTVKEDLQAEMKRRATAKRRLLSQFEVNGTLTTKDLAHFGTGVSSRIHELRKSGHVIVASYEAPGMYSYTYIGSKEAK
jgi:hypothetical protein